MGPSLCGREWEVGFGVRLLRETILEGLDPEGAQMPGSHIPTLVRALTFLP